MKNLKKAVSLITSVMLCSSYGFCVYADSSPEYSSISIEYTDYAYSKGETAQINPIAYDENGNMVSFVDEETGDEISFGEYKDLTYTSSNENVVTINADGSMVMNDYGSSTITVSDGELSVSMLVFVTPKILKSAGYEEEDFTSVPVTRTGNGSMSYSGRVLENDGSKIPATQAQNLWYNGDLKYENVVHVAYFYDSMDSVNSEAAIGFAKYQAYNGTKMYGVINSADTTYKRIGLIGGNANDDWRNTLVDWKATAEDIKIKRTKGWHQVALVQKSLSGNLESSKPDSYEIYFDGIKVETGTQSNTIEMILLYAGDNTENVAYLDDASVLAYTSLEKVNVSIDENDSNSFVAQEIYYGEKSANINVNYQWYISDTENGEYTPIENAVQKTYTMGSDQINKFIKAGVTVTDTMTNTNDIVTNTVYSEPTFLFDGIYNSISLGKTDTNFTKGATSQLKVTGFGKDNLERVITDFSECTFISDNEAVASVDENGMLSANDYGTAKITVICGDMSASVIISVTPKVYRSVTSDENTTEISRRGNGATSVTGGLSPYYAGITAKIQTLIWNQNGRSNQILEGWFYDNGESENSMAGIMFKRWEDYRNTGAIGVINSSDTTYKISVVDGRWDAVEQGHMISARDTGIERTKGWHQVLLVEGNPSGNVKNGADATVTFYNVYLDGTLIISDTSTANALMTVSGFGGDVETNIAWFDDAYQSEYVAVQNVKIEENENDANTLTARYEYYGPNGNGADVQYQWYMADSMDAEFVPISGAVGSSYTIDTVSAGKFIKAGIKITDTLSNENDVVTNEYFTDIYSAVKTVIEYANNKVFITAGEDISNAVLLVAEYETKGEYETLVSVKKYDVSAISAGMSTSVAVGNLIPVEGKKIKVMLWDGINTQKSYCEPLNIN